MEFFRNVYNSLISWKLKGDKKPLLLIGARQIGKTTVLKTFGVKEYKDFIYLNLEQRQDAHSFFEGNKDPQKIIDNISLLTGVDIQQGDTLIVLDEIQECRDALIALKYFAEEMPDLHIIGAGSLLGLSIGNTRSFPVGKIEFLDMYPLTFEEYLQAADEKLYKVYDHILKSETISPINEVFFNSLKEIHKEYILFGGMPEVAAHYIQNRNVEEAQRLQDYILQAYQLDFVKHADKTTSTKIQQVWNSIPSQLAKENKKFIYKLVKSGARAREYEVAIQWLIQAGLIYKIPHIETPSIPLKAYEDVSAYKLYVFETGLLMRLSGLDPRVFIDGNKFFKEFKGSIAENYVADSLIQAGIRPYYWTSGNSAEIDFVIENKDNCIPIEVKSGDKTKAKSLASYKKKYNPKLRIRVSNLNLTQSDDLVNLPLFYAESVKEWVEK